MKEKSILIGVDGRPSMKGVYSQMTSGQMFVRRQIPKRDISYYRHYSNNNSNEFVKVEQEVPFANSVLIRWGNRISVPTDKSTIVYNRAEAIALATNKAKSRQLFIENGIRCPQLVTPDTIQDNQYPVIARPNQHSKGKKFVVLKDYGAFVHHYDENHTDFYYSEFIDKQREFRIHCASGKVIAIMEKPAPTKEGVIAWNRSINGEEFTAIKWSEWDMDACLQALNAVKCLGLDFGGVDVMLKDGLAYVLEVNTAPTLNSSPYVTTKYALYFDWLFREETRREHFDYTKYKKVESFAWKNFNLLDQPANDKS